MRVSSDMTLHTYYTSLPSPNYGDDYGIDSQKAPSVDPLAVTTECGPSAPERVENTNPVARPLLTPGLGCLALASDHGRQVCTNSLD